MQRSALKAVHRRKCYTYQKNIKMPNKVTEVIYCHCEAVASIMRATVFIVVSYTHASPSGYQLSASGSTASPHSEGGR